MKNIKFFIYAALLYLPTLAYVRVEFYFLVIAAVFYFDRAAIKVQIVDFIKKPFDRKHLKTVGLITLIMLLSISNKIFNGYEMVELRDYYASFYLFPLLFWVGKYLGVEKIFRFLILLTALECVVAIFEYSFGVRSFFQESNELIRISDRSLLYNSRCYGLSANSSILAYKLFIAFLLIEYCRFKKGVQWLLRLLLLAGVLISFSRSIIIVLLVYWFLLFCVNVFQALKNKDVFKRVSFQFNFVVCALSLIFFSTLMNQITRGDHQAENPFSENKIEKKIKHHAESNSEKHALEFKTGETKVELQGLGDQIIANAEKVQSSGRKLIWLNYINFIENNLLFGNGSNKLMYKQWVERNDSYKLVHAHNSYLQLAATNGVIISLLYFLFYLLNFKSKNYLVVSIILLYSMVNYGIFWGFSYLDVIFIAFLTINFKRANDYQRKS